jgi:ABC-type multidrug transport system fused ATPase/permease subunit
MDSHEKLKWVLFAVSRATLSFLDLVGILGIGYIATSTAVFLTSGSDPNRVIEFSGLTLPAINAETLPWFVVGIVVIFLLKALASILLTRQSSLFVAGVEARASRAIAEVILGRDIGEARTKSREDVMYVVSSGSPAAFNTVLNSVNTIVTELSLFIIICLGFFFVNAWATLAALLYFGMIAAVMQLFVGSFMNSAAQVGARETIRGNSAISDLISVFRELSVLGRRDAYLDQIYDARLLAARSSARIYFLGGMPRYIIESALIIGVAIFLFFQSFAGDVSESAGTIGVFLSGGFRLTAALLPLQNSLLTLKSVVPPALLAHNVLSRQQETKVQVSKTTEAQESEAPASGPVSLEFNNVSFRFDDSAIDTVSQVSFKAEPGSQLALIGVSGAGKSTIADLICGILIPSEGKVTVGSKEVRLAESQAKSRVSYVPQRPGLVSGTILDNVALASKSQEVDRMRVLESLKLANLSSFIDSLPDGLETSIGKLQDGFSGGQMQRLGLARALYSNPGLLVMDEATSSLDAESESEIQKALEEMRGKVTVVLIAHRLNTIQHADKVLLLSSGTLVDSGKFQEVVSRNPEVKKLIDLMRIDSSLEA